jgi:hypothetical protein
MYGVVAIDGVVARKPRQMMDARDDEANPILQRDVSRARRDRNRARMADLSDLSSEKYLLVSN